MPPRYIRFADLKELGIVDNWVTLGNWIRREGFPPGVKLGPNTTAWPEPLVEHWLANRPSAKRDGTAAA